jgi:hypothetical protein
MRKFVFATILLLVLSLTTFATITGTDRGTGNNNTGATTTAMSPTSNYTANSFGVLVVALDNAGSAGASTICPSTATDSIGNLWTRRLNVLFDNGAASAGIELCILTAPISSFPTTANLTVTWGASTTAEAWAFHEFTASGSNTCVFVTSGSAAGATSAAPTVTTSSITSGDAVIGGGASESSNTWAGDADTTNGNWSTQQTNVGGSGTSGAAVTSQRKIVTGTATQTYNPTLTSADTIIGWIQITEVGRSMGSRQIRMEF